MSSFSSSFSALINGEAGRFPVVRGESLELFHRWVSGQLKVETHVHLEAAVDESFYRGCEPPSAWRERVPWERAPFESLRGFIGAWVDLSKAIRHISDFERMAESFVARRSAENIRYTEAYISPADFSFIRQRFSIAPEVFEFEQVIRSYVRGLRRGLAAYPETEVRLIVDTLWISNSAERQIMLESLKNISADPDCKDAHGCPYVVAVGLGGMETHQNLDEQKAFFNQVRALGYKLDIHSGEGGNAETHRTSIEALAPDRVAHGFAAWNEKFVFTQNIVMCPLSNLLLKTFTGKPHEHPVFECLEQGVPLSIGSDDPILLGNTLDLEYVFLHAFTGRGEEIFAKTQKYARERVLAPEVLRRVVG